MLKQKIISLILLLSITLTLIPHVTHAGAWGEDIYAAVLERMLEEAYLKIKETIIANLKIAAIRIIQARLNSLIGGTGMGGPMFVTNWRDEIYGSARRDSSVVVNNYFQNVKSRTPGSEGQKIVTSGEKMYNTDYTNLYPDLDKYMRQGTSQSPDAFWRLWLARAEIQNQPFIYSMVASGIGATEYAEKAGANATALQSSGVKPKTAESNAQQGGKYGPAGYSTENEGHESISEKTVTMPLGIIESAWAEIQNMGTKMLTLARSIPEIATAMVSQMITQMIQQGVTNINAQIDRQINQFRIQSGLPINQVQNYIQGGVRSVPNIPIR